MSPLRGLLDLDPATIAQFAWTLLHFVWQGFFLAALLWAVLKIPGQSPLTRYIAALLTLLLMVTAPIVTYRTLHGEFDDPGPLILPADLAQLTKPIPLTDRISTTPGLTRQQSQRAPEAATVELATTDGKWNLPAVWAWRVQRALPWIIVTWLALVLALVSRQAAGLMLLRRTLKLNTSPLRESAQRLHDLPERVGVRRKVQFVECPLLEVPATVGGLHPLVLVPAVALEKLTDEQLDALVAHELAHIRRYDYLVNLVQSAMQALLAFQPAVWWVSSRVREERETCCDEVAAEVTGSRKAYAQALKTMEQLRPTIPAIGPALSAAGGPLLRRIARLASAPPRKHQQGPVSRTLRAVILGTLVTIGVLFVAGAQLLATRVNVEPPRGLGDVAAISDGVYKILGVHSGNGDVLRALRRVVETASDDGKRFDPQLVEELVFHLNRDPRASALFGAQMPLTNIRFRRDYQVHPWWKFGNVFHRLRIGIQIRERAIELAKQGHPGAARDYARAVLLLAAQDGALEGISPITKHREFPQLARLAQLTPRQVARIQRAVDDHRKIMSVCRQGHLCALYSLRALNSGKLTAAQVQETRDEFVKGVVAMLRVSSGRPDVQWTIANLCWQARSITAMQDSGDNKLDWRQRILSEMDDHSAVYLRRWMNEALNHPSPVFDQKKSPDDVRREVEDWLRQRMHLEQGSGEPTRDKRLVPSQP